MFEHMKKLKIGDGSTQKQHSFIQKKYIFFILFTSELTIASIFVQDNDDQTVWPANFLL